MSRSSSLLPFPRRMRLDQLKFHSAAEELKIAAEVRIVRQEENFEEKIPEAKEE